MKRSLACLLFVVALVGGCTGRDPEPTSAPITDDAPSRCDPQWDAALQKWSRAGFSGSVAISTAGEFDCVGGYGLADRRTGRPNTPETVFAIGSVSKAFTAAAVFTLVDAGRLRLGDRAGDIVSTLEGPASRRYLYSNAGYTLLALIVDTLVDSGYRSYVTAHVLRTDGDVGSRGFWDGEPAATGPRAVGYLDGGRTRQMGDFAGPHWALNGDGGLAMSMPDLATWTYALLDGAVLSAQSTRAVDRPGIARGDGAATPGWVRYGASVYGQPVLVTSGGGGDIGHNTVVAWLPKSERVIAIASNTPDLPAEDLLAKIAPAFLTDGTIVAPPDRAAEVHSDTLDALSGRYELAGGAFDVASTEDGLRLTAHGTPAVEALFPAPDTVRTGDAERHQRRVLAMLSGQTSDGEAERAAIESDFGPIIAVEPIATVVVDGELRTYVTITTDEAFNAWYAVDRAGQIAAAEAPAKSPSLAFVPAGQRRFVPDDPADTGPDISVTFGRRRMVVAGPNGSVTARRAR